MLDNFLHFILKQKLLVILGSILLLAAGFIAWKNLPIDAFPDVTNEQVMILTEAPGLAGCQRGTISVQDRPFSGDSNI
jgi:cobalt-zinc-cadmium resistance protein CzcA